MLGEAVGGGGRVVPGLSALGDSTNAAQRQNRPVPKGWGGIGFVLIHVFRFHCVRYFYCFHWLFSINLAIFTP